MQSWAGNTGIAFLSRGTSSQIYIQNSTPDISGGPGLQGGFVQLSPWRNGSGALIIPAPMYVRTSQSQNHWSQSSCGSHPRPSACRGLRDRLDDSSTGAGGGMVPSSKGFQNLGSVNTGGRKEEVEYDVSGTWKRSRYRTECSSLPVPKMPYAEQCRRCREIIKGYMG
jgi:hypothetical protein